MILLGVAACTTASPSSDTIELPIAEVERARELKLDVVPPVRRITREEYATQSEMNANESTEEDLRELRDSYGRLGFFPLTFDPRSTARATSEFYGAYYSQKDKNVTVIDAAEPALLVHELTHALQDQHFDLSRLLKTAMSTDQALAQRGLVEGDAVLAEERYDLWQRGDDPTSLVAAYITPAAAREASEKGLDASKVPLLFAALPSFAYSYGAAYVVSLLDAPNGRWSYAAVNEHLRMSGPASTQEVLRLGRDVDPIEATGLSVLPADVAAEYTITAVDRLGEYYTYLLFRPLTEHSHLQQLTAAWDGDQLVLLKRKDGGASSLVWTSIWESADEASEIAQLLVSLHAGDGTPLSATQDYTAGDGETFRVEQRDNQVCFVKNMKPGLMEHLARVTLETKDERRMDIVRVVATLPPMMH